MFSRGGVVKHLVQPRLRRGQMADKLGLLLLIGLLLVLVVAVFTGVRSLHPLS